METHHNQRDSGQFPIEKWLDLIAGSAQGPRLVWTQLLKEASRFPEEKMAPLLQIKPTINTFKAFLFLLHRDPQPLSALDVFYDYCNESTESISDWLEGLKLIERHCQTTAVRPNLCGAVGYVHCSVAMIGSDSRYDTLPNVVQDMLTHYGYEGRQERSHK